MNSETDFFCKSENVDQQFFFCLLNRGRIFVRFMWAKVEKNEKQFRGGDFDWQVLIDMPGEERKKAIERNGYYTIKETFFSRQSQTRD